MNRSSNFDNLSDAADWADVQDERDDREHADEGYTMPGGPRDRGVFDLALLKVTRPHEESECDLCTVELLVGDLTECCAFSASGVPTWHCRECEATRCDACAAAREDDAAEAEWQARLDREVS